MSMRSTMVSGVSRSTSHDCRLCACGASKACESAQRRMSRLSAGGCQAAMASSGKLLSQALKVVTVAAAMNPPPAMRNICRLFMVFLPG